MKYKNILPAKFIARPNRFIAKVLLHNEEIFVHVKNTGRCKELLLPGATVYLSEGNNPLRKTKYDLIAVEKKCSEKKAILINMDSQAPNEVFYEWLKVGKLFLNEANIKREVFYKASRFDFFVEDGNRRAFLEVKGVTLEKDGICLFPDAPTQRGIKHIEELIKAKEDGYEAYVVFIIQMKEAESFSPNDETHRAFGDALRKAEKAGVEILAFSCSVTCDTLKVERQIAVKL